MNLNKHMTVHANMKAGPETRMSKTGRHIYLYGSEIRFPVSWWLKRHPLQPRDNKAEWCSLFVWFFFLVFRRWCSKVKLSHQSHSLGWFLSEHVKVALLLFPPAHAGTPCDPFSLSVSFGSLVSTSVTSVKHTGLHHSASKANYSARRNRILGSVSEKRSSLR